MNNIFFTNYAGSYVQVKKILGLLDGEIWWMIHTIV